MTTELLDRLLSIMADVFSVPRQMVTLESTPSTIGAWDSLGHLNLILTLEQDLGVKFTPEEMDRMASARECLAIVAEKLGDMQEPRAVVESRNGRPAGTQDAGGVR